MSIKIATRILDNKVATESPKTPIAGIENPQNSHPKVKTMFKITFKITIKSIKTFANTTFSQACKNSLIATKIAAGKIVQAQTSIYCFT